MENCKKGHKAEGEDGFSKNTHIIINQHVRSKGSHSQLEKQREGHHLFSITIKPTRSCFHLYLTSNLRQKYEINTIYIKWPQTA